MVNKYNERRKVISDINRRRARTYLGGKCAIKDCAETEVLDFDHIDRLNKTFEISQNLFRPWDIIQLELDKCQLLCKFHHGKKSTFEQWGRRPWRHGTPTTYNSGKCRCGLCKKAWSEYMRKRRRKLKVLTVKEISRIRGELKAKKRGGAMIKRTQRQNEDWEFQYQVKLAKKIVESI